jgi:signal transduction histidine kinase
VAALDIELFERAVANLVDNALKFCAAGGRITLRVGRGRQPCRSASPTAAPASPRPNCRTCSTASTKARQSVAPATGEGGKGLGLAIVKRIAELHGGQVRAASTPGQGTVVTLVLPRA